LHPATSMSAAPRIPRGGWGPTLQNLLDARGREEQGEKTLPAVSTGCRHRLVVGVPKNATFSHQVGSARAGQKSCRASRRAPTSVEVSARIVWQAGLVLRARAGRVDWCATIPLNVYYRHVRDALHSLPMRPMGRPRTTMASGTGGSGAVHTAARVSV